MKKSLVALAVLAASGAAMAQSSVTLFGNMDARYAVGKGSVSNKTALANNGMSSSAFGVRGVEDLGGGMKAGFHLEADVGNDDGTGRASNSNNQPVTALASAGTQGLTWARKSVATLSGSMGELVLGRDYTPHFWSETVYDPFATNGVGTNIGAFKGGTTGVRASNSIGFKSVSVGGAAVWLQTYMGENASTAPKAGNGNSYRFTYDQGALSLAFAGSKTTTGAGVTNDTGNIGGSYDLGVAKLTALSMTTKITGAADIKGRLIGALVPMGRGTFKVSQSQTDQAGKVAKLTAVGYVHDMSARTKLYATYGRVGNSGGSSTGLNGGITAANQSSTGYDFGLRHSF